MKLSERISELQWIFTRIILWYKKQPKHVRKKFYSTIIRWIEYEVDDYGFDPREPLKDAPQSKRHRA